MVFEGSGIAWFLAGAWQVKEQEETRVKADVL